MLAAGLIAHKINSESSKFTTTVTGYIRNSTGTGYESVKDFCTATCALVKQTIYCITTPLAFWLIDQLENAPWMQQLNNKTDNDYLIKCRDATHQIGTRKLSMDLQSLFTAVPDGVSSQEQVIAALAAHAIASDQRISQTQIREWVALGERLIAELNSGKASEVEDGAILVTSPKDGQPIYVQSSVYSSRALMWYFNAQALWGELIKQEVLVGHDAKSTAAEAQNIVKNCLRQEYFIFPDYHGRIFTFLQHAKSCYKDNAELLCQDSALLAADKVVRNQKQSMTLPVIDDTSRYLPGGACRVVFNALLPVEQNGAPRVALRLEALSAPAIFGQRAEGHESLLWHATQMALAVPRKIVTTLQSFNQSLELTPKTQAQQRQHMVYKTMLAMLRRIKSGDAAWQVNQKAAFDAVNAMPLHELIPYLVHPEHAKAYNATLEVLNEISDIERDQLKTMIYRALLKELQAGEDAPLYRRGNEALLMPHNIDAAKVYEYWRTHITLFEEKIFGATFNIPLQEAQLEEKKQNYFSWIIYKILQIWTPTEILQTRKAHEQKLFQAAYIANLREANAENVESPNVIIELDIEAELEETEQLSDDDAIAQFEYLEKPIANTAMPLVTVITLTKPTQIEEGYLSLMVASEGDFTSAAADLTACAA
jgi:hypothetical protein